MQDQTITTKPKCSTDGCLKASKSRGLCQTHYNSYHWHNVMKSKKRAARVERVLIGKRPTNWWIGLAEFTCLKCLKVRSIDGFKDRKYTSKNGKEVVAKSKICRICATAPMRLLQESKDRTCKQCDASINHRSMYTKICEKCANKNFLKRKSNGRSTVSVRNKWKILVIEMRGGPICELCGFTHEVLDVFEFHHREPSAKKSDPSRASGLGKYKEETAKCDLLCANCHRIVHYKERMAKKSRLKISEEVDSGRRPKQDGTSADADCANPG